MGANAYLVYHQILFNYDRNSGLKLDRLLRSDILCQQMEDAQYCLAVNDSYTHADNYRRSSKQAIIYNSTINKSLQTDNI